jgi:hypothetical protein
MWHAADQRLQFVVAGVVVASIGAGTVFVGCGGASAATHDDAGAFDAGPPPLGPDGCASASGYLLCGGSHDCPRQSESCQSCISDPDAAGLCVTANMNGPGNCPLCDDGNVCIRLVQGVYECVPFDVGQLFAANGAPDRVRYTDWSDWTGQALPRPTDCGDGGLPLCGGLCGPCPQSSVCTGRSPLHPYGFCVPSSWSACTRSAPTCSSGSKCFVFSDQPDAQALADQFGLCLPTSECEALAAGYPGGGICVP